MSEQHSLFMDSQGRVWSCGENKEGQCGLGTPHDILAQQHHRAWHQSLRPSEDALLRDAARGQKDKYTRYLQLLSEQEQHSSQVGVFKAGFAPSSARKVQQHRVGLSAGGGMSSEGAVPMSLGFGGFDVESYMTSSGLMPGQLHTPTRVGRPHHPLLDPAMESWLAQEEQPGLEGVVDIAAARHFSLAATFTGEVWTWGACFNGGLGSEASWSSAPQQVGEELGAVLCAAGGAVKVAAGGTFAMALTSSGKVVVWGKLGGGLLASVVRTCGTEISGLPPITCIAAGQQHALMTDGQTVWALGRWVDSAGREAGLASWDAPQKVLSLPGQQITQIVAGPHTSAAVTADGRLYMWGRLLDVHHAEGLGRRLHRDVVPEDVNWSWAGFGADVPMRVEGLEGVRAVGLGGWHAVALLD